MLKLVKNVRYVMELEKTTKGKSVVIVKKEKKLSGYPAVNVQNAKRDMINLIANKA